MYALAGDGVPPTLITTGWSPSGTASGTRTFSWYSPAFPPTTPAYKMSDAASVTVPNVTVTDAFTVAAEAGSSPGASEEFVAPNPVANSVRISPGLAVVNEGPIYAPVMALIAAIGL